MCSDISDLSNIAVAQKIEFPMSENDICEHAVCRAMVLAISRWHLTKENRVRPQVSPYVVCGGQRGISIGFSPSTSASPAYVITPMLYSHIY